MYSIIICIMKFVDRNKELSRLKKELEADESRMVVVYGRRRIGKSTLIRKAMNDSDIYFQADETQTANQLYRLAQVIDSTVAGFGSVSYPDWESLLKALNYRVEHKLTLCLDEFPYLVKSFPALPSVIQRFWDTSSPRFNLILCGSAQQSMHDEILNTRSPLYGRADCIIHLQPIEAGYIHEAMELDSHVDAVTNHAFWGGVPRYWALCKKMGTFEEGVRELMLSAEGTLVDEPDRLLRDELRDLTFSRTLLSVVGNGVNRVSEIAARLNKSATELSAPLKRLTDLGYLTKETPFGAEPKNTKKTIYRLSDPFMSAYYQFVVPNLSLISMGKQDVVWRQLESHLTDYVGHHWEILCRRAISGAVIDGIVYGEAQRWWGTVYDKQKKKGEQKEIDVVAMSLDRKHLLFGECKWTGSDYAERLLDELKEKTRNLAFIDEVEEIHFKLFLREKPKDTVAETDVFYPANILKMLK